MTDLPNSIGNAARNAVGKHSTLEDLPVGRSGDRWDNPLTSTPLAFLDSLRWLPHVDWSCGSDPKVPC